MVFISVLLPGLAVTEFPGATGFRGDEGGYQGLEVVV
jgi:hypothetical protein